MRRMKQLLLAGAILVSPFAMAQGERQGKDKDPKAMAEARTARMTEDLSLIPDQVEKVKDLNYRYAEKKMAIRQQENKEEKKASMEQLKAWRHGELKNILTADQHARMEELRKERKEKYKEKKKGDQQGKGMERRRSMEK